MLLWAWRRGLLWVAVMDLCAVPLAVGYGIGRIGCQLSGDGDYGKPWDGPWAMAYPHGTVPTDVTVHPTPIYETLAMGVARPAAVARARPGAPRRAVRPLPRRRRASSASWSSSSAATTHVLLGLTAPQLESLAMTVAGLVWLPILRAAAEWRTLVQRPWPRA